MVKVQKEALATERSKVVPSEFGEFIAQNKEMVYQKLCEYMPSGDPKDFNNKMVRAYPDSKGQYRRPSYLLLWTLLYGGNLDDAILPAAIQQLSEDYFLIHDDWMDKNAWRRGRPSEHVLFGEEYAILAGDTLHAILWKMAKDAMLALGGKRGNFYFDKVYDIMMKTHQGQYYDLRLTNEVKDITKFSLEDYYQSIWAKSGYYTVCGPMQCGAIIGGADEKELEKMYAYGIPVGKAFQIKDDILDASSTVEILGKTIGTDVMESTKTLILLHAVQNAPTPVLNKLKKIYAKPREKKTDAEVQYVLRMFKELGSLDYAQKESERLAQEAIENFNKLSRNIKEGPIKRLARDSIANVAKRKK